MECPFTVECWRRVSPQLQPPEEVWKTQRWLDIFSGKIWPQSRQSKGRLILFIAICWQIWLNRNQIVFAEGKEKVNQVVYRAWAIWTECMLVLDSTIYQYILPRQPRTDMFPPSPVVNETCGVFTSSPVYIIVDGSVEGSSRLAGAAYVGIQDTPRRVLGAGFTWWPWASPLRAELEAIRMGIQACRSWGGNQMIVCSDSHLLITLLQGTGMGPSILQHSIEHFRTMVDASESVVFQKVSRDAVQAPEALAKYARRERITRHTRMMKDDAIRQILQQFIRSFDICINYVKNEYEAYAYVYVNRLR
ncbi:hypothetical protein QJS10_CPA01g02021 [Acorus calamus]|uniref:RNase H type-1 domain-containing protein n=1 Tax=Acorus calamus TaxID=4465 RepID=A0AAV9FGB0_ACOCL|nr:hypothetical protein QJS10_CPA01g02021 [Acorus calamus]